VDFPIISNFILFLRLIKKNPPRGPAARGLFWFNWDEWHFLPSQKIDMGTLTSAKLCVDSIAVVPNVLRCVFEELSTKRKNWENVRRLILEDLNYDHNW